MGPFWYFDETSDITPDNRDKPSPDNISFNGQLVNRVGPVICAGSKRAIKLSLQIYSVSLPCKIYSVRYIYR